MKPARLLQPRCFHAFRCIGADCEDTCCSGWIVTVDKPTYDKYRNEPALAGLVTVYEKATNDEDYGRIQFDGAVCPCLSEGLCSIQQRWGEAYLSNMCATYPRVLNRVDEVVQRSLSLSCPEAARIVLLDPQPMEFDEEEYADGAIRLGEFASLDTSALVGFAAPYGVFREIRKQVLAVLQNRSYPVWQRLFQVGCLCERLDDAGRLRTEAVDLCRPDDFAEPCAANPTAQLETVLELIVDRLGSDYNPPRFLACYREFMDGIQWTSESSMEDIGGRYAEAASQHYAEYMSRHEYILEHYLVNYAHRSLFPFGLVESNRKLLTVRVQSTIAARYMLMAAYFAILQTLLIGMAAFHKAAFGAGPIVKLVQSFTKTFEHSVVSPVRVIDMLAEKGMTTPASLCVLIRN